tara:strand:+ start:1640 stop:3058 length:1419 start_codon:yes stop_codon:yes gene_type:complete
MAIINAKSPYFVSITDANISYSTLEIYIYSGAKTATVTAEYNLQKSKIGTSTKVSFEISELIRDYLDVTFDGNYDTTAAYEGSAKWVKTIIKAFNSAGTQVGSTVTETNITLDGYSYFEEGSSFTMSDKSLFKSDGDIFLPKFGDSNIAIYTENNPTVLLLDSAGATVDTSTFATSVQSDEQIKYVSLYPELITNFGFDNSLNWSIQSSDVIEDGLLKFGGQNGSRFPTDFTQVQNKNYVLKFTITDVESGNLSVFSGSSGQSLSGLLNTSGDYVYQYTHNSAAANSFSFFTSDNFIGSIDNTSVKEVYEVAKISVTDDNGTTKENVKQVEECKFKPHKITFINKNGVLDDMYFFKKSSNSMTTKRESYNANTIKVDNTYSINEHNKIDFNITANSTVKLSSGFLNESTNEIFKQLLLSERVWITRTFENSELVLPINIKTSSISYKTSLNDRLVEYSIDFDDSYESINNIR